MNDTPQPAILSPDLVARFAAIVGPEHALTDPDQQLPYLREWRDMYEGRASVVLRPGSTEEVAKILALANEHGIPVVPQAGNTGLVGGQIPMRGEIVLSVGRLKRVRAVDPQGFTMTVEAGLTLAAAQAVADDANRLFPLSLPSEGTCQIGGNLGTNAGGVGVLAYGNARQLVLGLEVVLADGRVWSGLSRLKKDNTGYDLKDLFIGSEGTLGVITAAVLKLFPKPAEKATAFVALPDLVSARSLFGLAQEACGAGLTAFELMSRIVVETIARHAPGTRDPFPTAHPWYVLMETSGLKADGAADRLLTQTLEAASEHGLVTDAAIASSLSQARDFWRLRESYSEAQKPLGANVKNDVSVPVAAIPEFIARADAAVERICPGVRPLPISHFGDGNIHYNVAQPPGMARGAYMALWDDIVRAVHEVVLDLGGSISAEHGIGVMKRAELAQVKGAVAMDLMRKIKAALDPKGILNPGKVL
jgi:FAD/FMN-containing dehydrogenase